MTGHEKCGSTFPAALIALFAAGWSLTLALGGGESLCVLSGCELYRDVVLFGLSLWWYGFAGFLGIAATCVLEWRRLALGLAATGVALDCGLLAWMAFSVPCSDCLIAAALFFSIWLTLLPLISGRQKSAAALSLLWLLLFSPNLVAGVKEFVDPWPLVGENTAPIRIFFSPSCAACRDVVQANATQPPSVTAFYPVAENDDDLLVIRTMGTLLGQGETLPQALAKALAAERVTPDLGDRLAWELRAYRNRLTLARLGVDRIPVTVIVGAPNRAAEKLQPGPSGATALPLPAAGDYRSCRRGDTSPDCN